MEEIITTTWSIAVDWDRNGSYTDTYDDVTDRVISDAVGLYGEM